MTRNLLHVGALADCRGRLCSPGAILLEGDSIIGVGRPEEVGAQHDTQITQIDGTVVPSLVNTHTHLDLSDAGLSRPSSSFLEWLREDVAPIRQNATKETICKAVKKGEKLSLNGGCLIVGDIAGTLTSAEAFQNTQLLGCSFVEVFGQGIKQEQGIAEIEKINGLYGVQPHAPYSCGPEVYSAAFASNLPLSTHLAEMPEELEAVTHGTGDIVAFSKGIGAWDPTVRPWGVHPVDAICSIATKPFIAAHCNYVAESQMQLLLKQGVTVVYCPRASKFFGHTKHNWKAMLNFGINVALGTDSLLCLNTPDRISILDDMRLLYHQDDICPKKLFEMGTINGAKALGLDPSLVLLTPGKHAGLFVFNSVSSGSLSQILKSSELPKLVVAPKSAN